MVTFNLENLDEEVSSLPSKTLSRFISLLLLEFHEFNSILLLMIKINLLLLILKELLYTWMTNYRVMRKAVISPRLQMIKI